ncbi:hypothetical protein DNTS_012216 [Danionella cerebrum]|uniref:C-type lectin domain-containing protein n=1 Tax=Danionella cerebrum TaxID=2873325 RepID=A0A553QHM8_9TELE|nr:hypothetical protein DNTS_012216 [Danionella translucida]
MRMLDVTLFWLLCLNIALQPSSQTDTSYFLIYNEDHNRCMTVLSPTVVQTAACDISSEAQHFRWISSSRVLSVSFKLCVGVQNIKDWVKVLLLPCNELSPLQTWECKNETLFGLKGQPLHLNYGNRKEPNMMLYAGAGLWSRWQIYGTKEDLCSRGYQASSGWDSDPVTGVLYQRNMQSALTWHQAQASCQQQDAELLSITELHEQAFISGLTNSYGSALWIGLNSLDSESGWQWSNGNPFRYLNWAPGKNLPNFCPSAWVPYAGHCYYLQRSKKMWSDALAACHKEEADLASIHNIEEHSFILSQSGYLSNDELWIGLNDQRTQNLFEWSDRTHVTFTNWIVGEPSHLINRNEDCVLMKGKEGKWEDLACESEHGYICKKKSSRKPAGALDVVSLGCQAGWLRYDSYCYWIAIESKAFHEAKLQCEQTRARLIDVSNRYENAFLISLVGLRPEKYFWIGMSNTERAEKFQWTNGDKVKFTHFNKGMPERHQGCVAMLTGTSAGLWDVLDCNSKQKYICKKLAEGVTTTQFPPTTQPLSCPAGWIKKDPRNCIQVYNKQKDEKKTWFEARDFCRAIGGDLVSFHSAQEINTLPTALDPAWIGFSLQNVNSGFVWADESPSDFENWGFGEPNNYNNQEHCAESGLYYGRRWNDRYCESYNDWICQIAIGRTPRPPPTTVSQVEYNKTSDGWIQYNGSQYFINEDPLPMEEARSFCKKNNADLVVITGQTERKFLQRQMSRLAKNQFYIGMMVALDKTFSWVDGSPVVYTSWDQNEPNFANNDENCVTIYSNMGFWNDINCGVPLPSICKRGVDFINSTLTSPTEPPGGCTPEWTMFQGKCYKLFNTGMSWHKARDHCISHGGNLVSILAPYEQAFLTTLIIDSSDDVWIGFNDVNWEMRFFWTDGKGVSYTHWAKGHPTTMPQDGGTFYHGMETYDCVYMVRSPKKLTGFWKVDQCGNEKSFICKRKTDSQLARPVTTAQPQHFFSIGNDSYKVQMEKMSWDEARRQCKANDAELASVLDGIAQAYTVLKVSKFKEPLWIGLNSNLRSTDIAPTNPPQMPGNCPESKKSKTWIPFKKNCYMFGVMSDNWAHATVECLRMGASLVSIEDPTESQFIQRHVELVQDGTQSFWIGMHRSHMGEWMWIDNMVVDYTNWKPEMPSGLGKCVEIQSNTGMWNAINCNSYKPFICKTPKVIPPTEKPSIPLAVVEKAPHGSAGIAVGVVFVIIAVAGLATFLFLKRNPLPVAGECTFDNRLYFNSHLTRSPATVDTKGLVANIEQNENV